MFRCECCGRQFEEPRYVPDDPSPAGVALPSGTYMYQVCPYCGSDVLTVMRICPSCGDYYVGSSILCNDCMVILADGLKRIRRGMELKKDTFEEAIIDHYKW